MKAVHHSARWSRIVKSDEWETLITRGQYEALIFDCDGTLVESGNAHFNSFRDAISAQDETLNRAWYGARTGLDRRSLLTEFAASVASGFDVERAIDESISAFRSHVGLVRPLPETSYLLQRFAPVLPIAVGTNAEKETAVASLTATGLAQFIRHIVSVSDGLPPKPSPEIFATAAEKLGCLPGSSLVIEDSEQGVQAAKAASMDVLCLAG